MILSEEEAQKDERKENRGDGSFIQRVVYAQYCGYNTKREDIIHWRYTRVIRHCANRSRVIKMDGQSYVVKWRKLDSDTIDNVPFPRQFLEALGNSIRKLRPQRAIIYGSAVKQGLNARDIDLLIISEYFRKILWQDRINLLDLPPGPVYDVRLFTPAEFEILYPPTSPIRQRIESQYIDLEVYYAP